MSNNIAENSLGSVGIEQARISKKRVESLKKNKNNRSPRREPYGAPVEGKMSGMCSHHKRRSRIDWKVKREAILQMIRGC